MAATAIGRTMAGGVQPIVEGGYELTYLPRNQQQGAAEGGSGAGILLATQPGSDGARRTRQREFLFNLVRFAIAQSGRGTVGAEDREVAGGILTFTVTGAPPDHVLQQSQQKIIEQYRQPRISSGASSCPGRLSSGPGSSRQCNDNLQRLAHAS
jgi:hypothetical protein